MHKLDLPRRLVRSAEVCDRLGIGRSQLYKLISEGRFKRPIKHGRTSVWDETWIDDYIERLISKHEQEGHR